ncbi:MAG: hypothetical protein KGY67_02175 [Candidatus Thermoplasmatota archaeon]|nr:hypothetical protein [Candidatus Thermoplasmatota archaeon]
MHSEKNVFIPLLITITILLSLFSGCTTDEENNNSNEPTSNLTEKIIIPDQLKIVADFNKFNVSNINVKTGVKKYINEDDPQAGFQFSYVEGIQHDVDNADGLFLKVAGSIENIAEENLDYISITAEFTDKNQTNLNIQRNDTIRRLVPGYNSLFEISLQDDVQNFDKVEYIILRITM